MPPKPAKTDKPHAAIAPLEEPKAGSLSDPAFLRVCQACFDSGVKVPEGP